MRLLVSLLFILSILKSTVADYQFGYCSIVPVSGVSDSFSGIVKIYKNDGDNGLTFDYQVEKTGNLAVNSNYGVSINTYGYPESNTGDVFNPDDSVKGCPFQSSFRVGDLNDIEIDSDGEYFAKAMYSLPTLKGDQSIIGRSLVFYNGSICHLVPTALKAEADVSVTETPSIVATCVIGISNTTVPLNVPSGLTGVNTAAASTTETANGVAVLTATNKAPSAVTGQVLLSKVSSGVQIVSAIKGLSKDAHGFHIHAFGQLSDDGTALGGHWAITGQNHSLPFDNSTNRHYGDLGNICSFDAKFENAYYNYTTNYFQISGIYGHGFAVHATRDLGNTNVGGARVLQGVIAIANPASTPSVSPSIIENFQFDNICENGAVDGETSTGSSDSSNQDSGSSKLISSLFIFALSSLLVLLF